MFSDLVDSISARKNALFLAKIAFAFLLLFPALALSLEKPEADLEKVGITTQLGNRINLDLPFVAEDGSPVKLREVVALGRPFIIVPAYYHCPRLCGLVLKGVQELLAKLDLKLGDDFRVITVSFDSSDTSELARARAEQYHQGLNPASAERGWKFLHGEEANIKTLMDSLGFHYMLDKGEFAHSAAIMILTPDGQISQYFTGISFPPGDVKLALVEAGQGSIGTALDHFVLFCFRFDQTKGKYVWAAFNVMRAGAVLTLLCLAGLFVFLRRKERLAASRL